MKLLCKSYKYEFEIGILLKISFTNNIQMVPVMSINVIYQQFYVHGITVSRTCPVKRFLIKRFDKNNIGGPKRL